MADPINQNQQPTGKAKKLYVLKNSVKALAAGGGISFDAGQPYPANEIPKHVRKYFRVATDSDVEEEMNEDEE